MGSATRALLSFGLLVLTSGTLHAQWFRFDSDRMRHMEEARTAPRAPRSQLTRDQYLLMERDRQERWLNTIERRRELQTLQRLADEQQAAAQADRASWQLHERALQDDAAAYRSQRQQNRLLHEERLERSRQEQDLRWQERQNDLRRSAPEPATPPPIDYRGHGS